MSDADEITVYSDYVCPFCYLGRQSLSEYQAEREEELDIDWQPFDLRAQKRGPDGEIDHDVDDGKDDEYFEKARENVQRLKEEYGADEMQMDFSREVDSLDAQAASLYVSEEHPEQWLDFDVAIFEALWEEGRDIGDVDVLADLAEDVGLDSEEIREVAETEQYHDELRAKFREAQEHGVTGVPTFAYDGYGARGAVPPSQLRRLVEGT